METKFSSSTAIPLPSLTAGTLWTRPSGLSAAYAHGWMMPRWVIPGLTGTDRLLFRRYDNTGLGNHLFAWAEALLYGRSRDIPVIWPTWPQFSKEAVKSGRTYWNLFRNDGTYLGGLQRLVLLARYLSDQTLPGLFFTQRKNPHGYLWRFGDHSYEEALWLRSKFEDIVAPWIQRRVRKLERPEGFIGLHFRAGDFKETRWHETTPDGRKVNQMIETSWYERAVAEARRIHGNLPVVIISNGTDEELAPLCRLPNVSVQRENPVVDLLSMSKARAFVASSSTFSMWISYFGQMQTLFHPEHAWDPNLSKRIPTIPLL